MIKFEKVSYGQFAKDVLDEYPFMTKEDIEDMYNHIVLPKRSTVSSAGYDFYTPLSFQVKDKPILVPTGIRLQMPENYFLLMVPRSGMGFKTGISLANTVGIIDSDYFVGLNEGHIKVKLVPGFQESIIKQGDRFVQGIILPFAITDDDTASGKRTGGFGSSGK